MTVVVDSYTDAISGTLKVYTGYITVIGQSFTGNGGVLSSCKFNLNKLGSPTGNCCCTIYAHSGTFGTSSVGDGSALATSDVKDVATLGSSALVEFTFSGANKITLTNGTKYVVTFEYTGGDTSNCPRMNFDTITLGHGGNVAYVGTSGWAYLATYDAIFYVYSEDLTSLKDVIESDGLIAFKR